jgi:tetratricopeptide (TPR) repeat protein
MKAPRPARGWLSLVAGVVLGACLMLVGLAQAGKLTPPKDPEVLVTLAQLLETEHRRIDLMLEHGDVAGAIGALENLRAAKWPSRELGGDASVLLRHDVYGRLLRLRLDNPSVDAKSAQVRLQIVEEGLGKDYDQLDANPFTARLVAIRGEIYEELERDDDALTAYEEALDMNRALLDELLGTEPK